MSTAQPGKPVPYRQQLAQQVQAAAWARFRTSYPEHVWQQMTQPQQAQAWLSWQQNEQIVAAHRSRWTVGRIIGAVVIAMVVLWVLALVL